MTKVKVGKEDSSSTEFVEKRRAALERYAIGTVNMFKMLLLYVLSLHLRYVAEYGVGQCSNVIWVNS